MKTNRAFIISALALLLAAVFFLSGCGLFSAEEEAAPTEAGETPAPETPAPLDPLVFCTFGTKLNGQRWDAMPTQVLKYALANFTADNTPEFTAEVRARVAAIVAERGEA